MPAIAYQARTICLPVHIHDQLALMGKAERDLQQSLGHDPTKKEIAAKSDVKPERIEFLKRSALKAISMESELGGGKSKGSSAGLGGESSSSSSSTKGGTANLTERVKLPRFNTTQGWVGKF